MISDFQNFEYPDKWIFIVFYILISTEYKITFFFDKNRSHMMVNNFIFSGNAILRKCRVDVRKTNNVRNQFFLVGQDVSPSVCLKVFSFQKPTGKHFVPRVSKRKVLDNENVKLYTKSRNLSFSSSNLFRDYRYIKSLRSLVVKLRGD